MQHRTVPSFQTKRLRKTILDMAYNGGSGHIACAFSIVEILATLYREHLRFPENNPLSPGRDYLILSKGHGVMAQYACMYELGWISPQQITDYFRDGTTLKGLSDSRVPGLEATSGSLGHGLSVAVGIALACKLLRTNQRVYAIVGDGEANEGAIWEAFLLASHHNLNNLTVILDVNGFQAMGRTVDILNLDSLGRKLSAFGLQVSEVDGHNEDAIHQAILLSQRSEKPTPNAIVAHTVKGKGISFMENNNQWHYRRLDHSQYTSALRELTD